MIFGRYLFVLIFTLAVSPQLKAQEVEREISQQGAPRVGEISSEDQERVRARVNTLDLTSIAFGPAWTSDMNNDEMFYTLHFGRNWEVTTNAEIRLNLDAALASENEGNWISGTVGAGYLMSVENISPVIGAEFGYGYAHIDGAKDPAGFVLGGFMGVRFFRSASAQMSLEGFVQMILKDENAMITGLRLGVLF